ncbi:hypothetical protein COA27_26850 [Bacillus cereus]|nr:hypothetical protein CON29_16565 [Bacillus thuringiensis]PER63801.1 hypothetical protein CN502_24475 [Bacillus cereus]PEB73653.1 hypothetical protein COM89_21195 [Bacillus thuringiensis]PES52533.1 hypothetical protein CN515_12740 [Bacillus cereus]PFB14091.1 hypothetical protein CN408_27810 [Bacillus cereus]
MNMRVATADVKKIKKNNKEQASEKQGFISTIFASFKKTDALMVDIAPYKSIDKKTGTLVDRRDNLQVYLKVKTTDLLSMNQDDLKRFMNQLTSLCRVYHEPFKILSLTYSTETSVQQVFWKRMAIRFQNRMNREGVGKEEEALWYQRYSLAVENLNRVLWVEKNLKELAFFIVVYAKNEKELVKNVKDMKRYGGRQFDLQNMKAKEVEKLIFKLQNMNSEM